ncbi:DUF5677 domain-containing protein [Nocardia sp. NPDC127526]|uniref:DUF5677 domain-containing protein n=1 Tax=Nocardia sp. NPDC127526 TaxID=3345393 RepID=UPI003638D85B
MLSNEGREHLDIGRSLIAGFNEGLAQEKLELKSRSRDAFINAGVVLALAVHTHQLGAMILDLLERETPVVLVLPNLRTCYEAALTAHWVAQSTDAAAALLNEDLRQRRNLQRTLRESASLQNFADRVAHADDPVLPNTTASQAQAKSIEQMFKDFDGAAGRDAYAYYRLLCGYSHARGTLIDQYLVETDESTTAPVALCLEPKEPIPPGAIAFLTGCCLIWAGSAVRYLGKDKLRRRKELRTAAKQLGISPDIQLSDQARHRQK